jgi:hypothetical protein
MNEPDPAELLIMAEQCPLIRGAYASEDAEVIKRAEEYHPPSRCDYVKRANATTPGTA